MPNEVVGFKINGSTYEYDHEHLANLPTIDATPTANSTNAVQSGGVKSALDGLQAEIPTVDAVPTQGSTNAVSSGGVYTALEDKADKDSTPKIAISEEMEADLYVCDSNGNVIAEFADGHIKTKNFDSSDINTETDTTFTESGKPADSKAVGDRFSVVEGEIPDVSGFVEVRTPEETEADLYVCDNNGNVLAEFADGHIKTKNFDSGDIEERVEALEETPAPSGYEYIPSINPTNADADLYIADENGNAIARFGYGHMQTRDFDSRAITPKVITVKKDGTGDFTSVRLAVDSIHDASSLDRPYLIEIYPGTYNILEDYSQSEIEATGFVGLMLTDGISLIGVGNRNAVVLHGELDPDTYDSTLRNEVSTLNMCDTGSIENLTVTAEHIRYCVHDDFPATLPYFYRHVKNCRFSIINPTSGTEGKTWGEGAKQGKSTLLEDSDFGTCLLWHSDNTASGTRTINLTIKNCTAQFLTVRNINHSFFNTVHIYGGNFGIIRFMFDNGTVQTKMMSVDGDVKDAMIFAPDDWCYKTGDITVFPTNGTMLLQVGMLVRPNFSPFWTAGSLVVVTDPNLAYGVVVGIDDRFVYVQKGGYINAERMGLQNVSIGDKVTVSQSGSLELNGTGDEFGVIFASFTDYGSYIRRI